MWRNDARSFGMTAILFHWAIAALFLAQLPLGVATQATADRPALQFELYQWHKSLGFLILALSLLRLAWAIYGPRPAGSADLGPLERAAAGWAHGALYAATVAVPLTGWAIASASPLRIPTYLFDLLVVPPLPLGVSDAAEAAWSYAHAALAYAAAALAVLHIAAALRHHFVLRDGVLLRMLRPRPRLPASSSLQAALTPPCDRRPRRS
jgi:cytochrome b561